MVDVEISIVLLAILLTLIAVYKFYFKDKHYSSKGKSIPGPSSALRESEVFSKEGGGLAKYVMKLHEQYGPIVSFTLESLHLISIGSPELFKQHQHVFDRPVTLFMKQVPIIGEGSIQIANGDRGKYLHKTLSRPFSFSECKQYYPALLKISKELVQKLDALPRETHIPIQESMLIWTVKEVALLSFGYEFDDEAIARKQIQSYTNAFGDVFYGDDESEKISQETIKQAINDYREFAKTAIENRLKTRHLDNNTYFVDALLDMGLKSEEELDNAITFFTGAFHTTANLMTWLLYYIGKYPEVQNKIRQEFEEILGDRDVVHEDLPKLKYFHQVIDETLRHSCLAPFAARCCSEDTELGGYNIPANTPVIHCFGFSLFDPKYWSNPSTLPPTEFDPSRFSPENSKFRPALSFSPFGFAGKRICPGYRFAYVVITALTSQLLGKFTIRLVNEKEISKVVGFVTKPNTEIWMVVENRN